jgi:hypothetical protein
MANNRNKKRLQKFSDTRWSQHDYSSVIDQYDIFTTMVELKSEGYSKCSSKATYHTRAME